MKIKLSSGAEAIIDDEDYDKVSLHNWHEHRPGKHGKTSYAKAWKGSTLTNDRQSIWMHHLVMGEKRQYDHKNRDGLDNRKENLRPATHQQNGANCPKKKIGGIRTSQYRGVLLEPRVTPHKWQARISVKGRKLYLGTFVTEEEAARVYDNKAKEIHGEFAILNFPQQGE